MAKPLVFPALAQFVAATAGRLDPQPVPGRDRLTWRYILRYLVVILQFLIQILHPYAGTGTVSVTLAPAT